MTGPGVRKARTGFVKEGDLARFVRSNLLRFTLLALAIGVALAGILRDDVREVVTNATILCYSCIGLK